MWTKLRGKKNGFTVWSKKWMGSKALHVNLQAKFMTALMYLQSSSPNFPGIHSWERFCSHATYFIQLLDHLPLILL